MKGVKTGTGQEGVVVGQVQAMGAVQPINREVQNSFLP